VPRRPLPTLVALACTLVLSACGATTYVDGTPGTKQPVATLGWRKIDPVTIELPTGDAVGTATAPDLTGPLVVNIWASYCTPCKKELPLLQRLSTQGRVTVVGFTRDTRKDAAQAALARAGVTYPNWMDTDAKVALAMDGQVPINQVPSSLLIRDGKVVAVHLGEFTSAQDVLAEVGS
jgi:thiol-disulfide isomerase/thioredoxin